MGAEGVGAFGRCDDWASSAGMGTTPPEAFGVFTLAGDCVLDVEDLRDDRTYAPTTPATPMPTNIKVFLVFSSMIKGRKLEHR